MTGADRLEWLQGQATNDLRGLGSGDNEGPLSFCLCEPTGQIVAVCDLWSESDRFLLATDTACAPAVLKRFEDMVILEDVSAKLLELPLTCVQGPMAVRPSAADLLVLPNDRTGNGGWDCWGSPESLSDIPLASEEGVDAARLEAGIPKWGVDIGPRVLPPELGPAFESRHVSYAKGCYTGQEVLMRIHSRGHTNKTWVGFYCIEEVEPGSPIMHSDREVGTVTSAAVAGMGPIAAGFVRNEVARDGETVKIGNVTAQVAIMPLLAHAP